MVRWPINTTCLTKCLPINLMICLEHLTKADVKIDDANAKIKEIKRVSKPGRRVYSRAVSIPKIRNGLGVSILSTSKGVMSDSEAIKNNLGGEVICRVF